MFDALNEIFNSFAQSLSSVLPRSPFSQFLDQFENLPFLGFINWFIPICISFVGIGRYAFNVLSYPTSSSNYYIEWLPLFVWFFVLSCWLHLQHAEVPGPGISPVPQQ